MTTNNSTLNSTMLVMHEMRHMVVLVTIISFGHLLNAGTNLGCSQLDVTNIFAVIGSKSKFGGDILNFGDNSCQLGPSPTDTFTSDTFTSEKNSARPRV